MSELEEILLYMLGTAGYMGLGLGLGGLNLTIFEVIIAQKIQLTAPHSKPRRFLNDPEPPITPLKTPIGAKVRSVLKNSGNSLVDRH